MRGRGGAGGGVTSKSLTIPPSFPVGANSTSATVAVSMYNKTVQASTHTVHQLLVRGMTGGWFGGASGGQLGTRFGTCWWQLGPVFCWGGTFRGNMMGKQLGDRWGTVGETTRGTTGGQFRGTLGASWGTVGTQSRDCVGDCWGGVWGLCGWLVGDCLGVGGGVAVGGGLQSPSRILLHPPVGTASRSATVAVSRSNRKSSGRLG